MKDDPPAMWSRYRSYGAADPIVDGRTEDWAAALQGTSARPAATRRCDLYATVRRYEGVTDPAEAGRRVKEGFVPLVSKIPGFVAYYWVNAGGGVMISTSVFEDQVHEEESNRRAAEWVRANLAALLPNPPSITAGEVVAHTVK